jgi:hypothetical protein
MPVSSASGRCTSAVGRFLSSALSEGDAVNGRSKAEPDADPSSAGRPRRCRLKFLCSEQISATAVARGADLIVRGAHGRIGWQRVPIGCVTEAVINGTALPVLAVKL